MTVSPQEFPLAAEFPPATRERWRELAREVLRKSGVETDAPEQALSSRTYDGITVAPLYDAGDLPDGTGLPGLPPYVRGGRVLPAPWQVRQRHEVADPEAVLDDLAHGADSLWLALPPQELPRALAGVHLDLISIALDAGEDTVAAAETLLDLAAERGVPGTALRGTLGADPLGHLARTGEAPARTDLAAAAALARRCADGLPGLRALVVDALPYHEAGGGDAEELGCAVATGVAYLRALTEHGLSDEQAFTALEFRYAATADQFATIAKLRAARLLWARVAEVCGVAADRARQVQHAVTSPVMMTARDPWTNLLRTTVACFAAGVGGADAVTVLPFDARLGLPDAFSRRIARNTSTLLVEEAHVARVADPAGGSWYVERFTRDLAERAWEWFQEIERAGGMAAALESGLVAERLAATWAKRREALAHRRDPIIGVSEFPDLNERLPVRPPAPRPPAPRSPRALPRVRLAAEYEALRELADARPSRPTVFLATIGPTAVHSARASFAANLFAAGGIATVTSGPGTDPEAIAAAFAASGTPVACLCSSDRLYQEHATAVARALRAAGAKRIWLAGKGDYDGVDACLYTGCDALGVLRTTFEDLEVGA